MYNYTCNRCGKNFENKNKDKKYCSYFCAKQWAKGPKFCKHCGSKFERKGTTAKYCSQICAKSATKNGCDLPCKHCGKMLYVPGCKLKSHKNNQFCCWECNMAWQRARRPIRVCKNCGIEFRKKARANASFCSLFCKQNSEQNIEHLAEIRRKQAMQPNKLEALGYATLKELGFKFIPQFIFGKRFVADAYLPDYNLIVQFDGDWWHGNTDKFPKLVPSQIKQQSIDLRQNECCSKLGFSFVRFWETDLHKNIESVKCKLKEVTGV